MTDEPLNPVAEEAAALDRIARTNDGRLLHRYLRRVLETVIDFQEGGALHQQNGRRSLARDLMRHMAEGLEGNDRTDYPILTRSGGPVGSRHRGIPRRVVASPELSGGEPGAGSGDDVGAS